MATDKSMDPKQKAPTFVDVHIWIAHNENGEHAMSYESAEAALANLACEVPSKEIRTLKIELTLPTGRLGEVVQKYRIDEGDWKE